jgi:seryl-tRNA synthetase
MLDTLREHHEQRARHLVRDGEVWCPARESRVDMEKCFSCRNFQGMRSTDGRLYVKCQ